MKPDDFVQEPSWKARAEAKAVPLKEAFQRLLDAGHYVPNAVIEEYGLKKKHLLISERIKGKLCISIVTCTCPRNG